MRPYADTSFLLSLYLLQVHSDAASTYMRGTGRSVTLTDLSFTELTNGLNLALFRKEIDAVARARAKSELTKDLAAGVLVQSPCVWARVFEAARRLSDTYCETCGLRTLDVLHVACAQALGATEFLSFDRRQRELAMALNFAVNPAPAL